MPIRRAAEGPLSRPTMQATYNHWLVGLSVAVAVLVSYTALSLAARVAAAGARYVHAWLIGGALAMGIGIWSMHFIGMMAFTLPIALRYDVTLTLLSLAAAVLASGSAIRIAAGARARVFAPGGGRLGDGHGNQRHALPGHARHHDRRRASPTTRFSCWPRSSIAVAASFAALWLAFTLRAGHSWLMALARLGAALIMGIAISGMHYTGMAAARIGAGAYCFGGIAHRQSMARDDGGAGGGLVARDRADRGRLRRASSIANRGGGGQGAGQRGATAADLRRHPGDGRLLGPRGHLPLRQPRLPRTARRRAGAPHRRLLSELFGEEGRQATGAPAWRRPFKASANYSIKATVDRFRTGAPLAERVSAGRSRWRGDRLLRAGCRHHGAQAGGRPGGSAGGSARRHEPHGRDRRLGARCRCARPLVVRHDLSNSRPSGGRDALARGSTRLLSARVPQRGRGRDPRRIRPGEIV